MFTGLTITFLKEFGSGLWLTFPLLFCIAAVIIVLGQFIGKKEGWSRIDSFYWSFVTATTVGYGDFRPTKTPSKIVAILIAFLGIAAERHHHSDSSPRRNRSSSSTCGRGLMVHSGASDYFVGITMTGPQAVKRILPTAFR